MRCIVILAVLLSAGSAGAAEGDVASVESFVKRFAATFNENDPAALATLYEETDDLEVVFSSGIRHRGFKTLRTAYVEDQAHNRYSNSRCKILSVRVFDGGDTAIATFEHMFGFRVIADDTRWKVHVRTTSVLRRVKGEWRIALEHSSAIRDVDRIVPDED